MTGASHDERSLRPDWCIRRALLQRVDELDDGGDDALALLVVDCCAGAVAPALIEMGDRALVHQRLAPPTREC